MNKRQRALIAEDHRDWRRILGGLLAAEYDVVACVERSDHVLEEACRLKPDIVTLDVSMPGGSGLAALAALRAHLPGAVIVIVSANGSSLYRDEAFRRGADAYVVKAHAHTDLIPAIEAQQTEQDWQRRWA